MVHNFQDLDVTSQDLYDTSQDLYDSISLKMLILIKLDFDFAPKWFVYTRLYVYG